VLRLRVLTASASIGALGGSSFILIGPSSLYRLPACNL
jgi:hypothetical protein